MSKQHRELFLFPNYKIIALEGNSPNEYYTVKDHLVCFANDPSCKFVDSETNNRRLSVSNCKMLGRLTNITNEKCKAVFREARYHSALYPNFLDIEGEKLDNALDSIKSFLLAERWSAADDNTWIIIPKPAKKLTGKKFDVTFDLVPEDFGYGSNKVTLPVYTNEIKEDTKEIKYSVEVPDYIYDFLMVHPEKDKQPKSKVYTTNVFADLHGYLTRLGHEAHSLTQLDKELSKAEKVILVSFSAGQRETKDAWVHAYTGVSTAINYQYYIGYKMVKSHLSGQLGVYVDKVWVAGKGFVTMRADQRKVPVGNISGFKIIKWTQEREDFLTTIEINFKKLSDNLNDYLSDLDDNKLDLLIANNTKLLN
jgi:hypothetical protein